jgi:predicted DCC family thiol-disulfide oxidoreductase YuxK
VNRLVVLYDAGCPMCSRFRTWLVEQPHLVAVTAVPAGSAEARALLPDLEHAATLREITVVGDGGQLWTGAHAWVVCLWATAEHRALAVRLSTPLGLPVAKAMAYAAAGLRASLTSTRVPEAVTGHGYADDCDGRCQPV